MTFDGAEPPDGLAPLVAKLADRGSSRRRGAAMKLRKLARPEACSALQAALANEVRIAGTWETQYQMIMALAECACAEALPLVEEIAFAPSSPPMCTLAAGDAFVRLARGSDRDPAPVVTALENAHRLGVFKIAEGAMRAVALLRLTFDEPATRAILAEVERSNDDGTIFWTVVASTAWTGPDVAAFQERARGRSKVIADAAASAALGVQRDYVIR